VEVLSGGSTTLIKISQELTLQWDGNSKTLRISDLHEDDKALSEDFRIEVRRGDEVLWEASSQQGRVLLPPADLEQALQSGADQMIIRARE
jgi:hypothetical protein